MALALAATEYGPSEPAGEPVVVLHGLFGAAGNWAAIARRLGEARPVYALDLRNHGRSPWHESMAYEALAGDVLDFLEARGIARAALVGHSMGGKVAMTLALLHGERVGALVALDVAPVAYRHSLAPLVAAMSAVDLAAVSRRGQAGAQLAHAVPDAALRAFLLQNLTRRDGRLAWRLNLAALGAEMERIAGFPDALAERAYGGPALFLAGARSDYVRAEHEARIRRLFPRARIARLAGVGHWVHAEAPDALVREVEAFLAEAGAGRSPARVAPGRQI